MYELNDDMDELFRRAAKDYPLDTNTADWNKLQEAMQKADSSSGSDMPGSKKKSKRRFLWMLLLLLSLAWIGYEYSGKGKRTKLTGTENIGKSVATIHDDIHDSKTTENKTTMAANIEVSRNGEQQKIKTAGNNSARQSNFLSANRQPQAPQLAQTSRPVPAGYLSHNNSKSGNVSAPGRSPAPVAAPVAESPSGNSAETKQPAELITEDNDPMQTIISKNPFPSSDPTLSVAKEEEKNKDSADTKTPVEKKNDPTATQKPAKKSSHIKGLYLGVVGGPDLSNVKLQRIRNIGLNGGLVIGYQWNKRFSVESGAAWNKKHYYSEGQYFSTKNIYLPPNTKIENVKGDCNMIEWPVNLRYNLKNSGAVTWSATAGVSSYFMMREDYDYLYLYTNGQTADRSRSYNNTSNDWFSVINLGFAYSHQLGRTGSLRIEPYIKLPVKGLGIGSLPIMSSGVNVGFIKKIF